MRKNSSINDALKGLAKTWEDFAQTAIKMIPDLSQEEKRFLYRYLLSLDLQRVLLQGSKSTQRRVRKKLQEPEKYLRILQARALILSLWLEWLERNIIALTVLSVSSIAESEQGGALHQARAKLLDTLRQLRGDAEKERAELLQEIRVWEKRLGAEGCETSQGNHQAWANP